MCAQFRLLEGEKLYKKLSPSPFAFAKYYVPALLILIWTIATVVFLFSEAWSSFREFFGWGDYIVLFVLWSIGFILLGWLGGIAVLGSRKWVIALLIIVLWWALFLALWLYLVISQGYRRNFTIGYIIGVSVWTLIVCLIPIETYRKSFKYYVTDYRLVMIRSLLATEERSLRFSNIQDMDLYQSVGGRIFGYGTITPITASNIGLGSVSEEEAKREQIPDNPVVGKSMYKDKSSQAGGNRLETVRAKPSECLYAISDPKGIKQYIEEKIHSQTQTGYLSKIQELLEKQALAQAEGRSLAGGGLIQADQQIGKEKREARKDPFAPVPAASSDIPPPPDEDSSKQGSGGKAPPENKDPFAVKK